MFKTRFMKVLVTGATGYVGHNLAMALAKIGNIVHVLVRNTNSEFIPKHPLIKVFEGDITKKETILPAIENCETVFHTAALVRARRTKPTDFFDINVEGTRNMLEAAAQAGVKKFAYTSTAGVIGSSLKKDMREDDPRVIGFNTDYELSKFLAEKLVKEYASLGLHTVIAVATKVFGPGLDTHPQISINSVIRRYITSPISFSPLPAYYVSNYVFIDDLVQGHLLLAAKGRKGEKYILGGENISYRDFFKKLRLISGIKRIVLPIPQWIAAIFGAMHFILYKIKGKDPYYDSKAASLIYCNKSFTSDKAKNELGYVITPFTIALKQTIRSFIIESYAKQNIHADYRVQ